MPPTVVFVNWKATGESAFTGDKGTSSVIGIVERSDMSWRKSTRGVPSVWIAGSGSAKRLATSISRGGGRGAIGLAAAESAGGDAGLSGRSAALASGSSPAPPISRSNFPSGSASGVAAAADAGESFTRPSGSAPAAEAVAADGFLSAAAGDEVVEDCVGTDEELGGKSGFDDEEVDVDDACA